MNTIIQQLGEHGLLPVVTIENSGFARDLAAALSAAGLPVAEVTFRTDGAARAIKEMIRGFPDMLVGAGTILSTDQAQEAVDAGAKYIISPGLNPTVVEWCLKHSVPITPGICTPSDIERGLSLGLSMFKFFPAGAYGGLNTLKAISAPYRHVKFIPTGGINPENLKDYLANSAVHACGGSWLVPETTLNDGDFETIETLTREAVSIVKSIRA